MAETPGCFKPLLLTCNIGAPTRAIAKLGHLLEQGSVPWPGFWFAAEWTCGTHVVRVTWVEMETILQCYVARIFIGVVSGPFQSREESRVSEEDRLGLSCYFGRHGMHVN